MRRTLLAVGLAILCSVGTPTVARAWNPSGHMQVALLAYDELDPGTRRKLVAALRKHPRFKEDFVRLMPAEVARGSRALRDRWIVAHAATWPDLLRDYRKGKPAESFRAAGDAHHRGTWHYVNVPQYLSWEDRQALADGIRVNTAFDLPVKADLGTQDLNGPQAVALMRRELGSPKTSDADRAVALCWLLHVVGDLHQPMHAVAMFSRAQLPRGDRGGNWIGLAGGRNLHGEWDAALGRGTSMAYVDDRVADLKADAARTKRARRHAKTRDIRAWVDESYDAAANDAYTPRVLGAIELFDGPASDARKPKAHVSPQYWDRARQIARERALVAGLRMAAELKDAFR